MTRNNLKSIELMQKNTLVHVVIVEFDHLLLKWVASCCCNCCASPFLFLVRWPVLVRAPGIFTDPKMDSFVSKIFWPLGLHSPSGLLVGWNLRNFNGCVSTVLPNVEVCVEWLLCILILIL